jgi:hypothetical protein
MDGNRSLENRRMATPLRTAKVRPENIKHNPKISALINNGGKIKIWILTMSD